MSIKSLSIPKFGLLSSMMILGMLISTGILAKQTTILVVLDSNGSVETEFAGGSCANKSMGIKGCLKMGKGKKNEHFNFFFTDATNAGNWNWIKIQVREPFNNWGDPVNPDILDDLKISGAGGGNFFNANGEADLSAAGVKFKIKDKNDHAFSIQYRIEVTNIADGSSTVPPTWAHPVLENEGPN